MADRTRALVPARVTDERRRELAERLGSVHVSRIHEMPRIELYLDQLLTLVAQELEFMRLPDETLVTGSMVNNYVKQGVIPAPRRKRDWGSILQKTFDKINKSFSAAEDEEI